MFGCRASEELEIILQRHVQPRSSMPLYRLHNRPEITIFPEGSDPPPPPGQFVLPDEEVAPKKNSRSTRAVREEPSMEPPADFVFPEPECILGEAPREEKKASASRTPPPLVTLRGLRMQKRIYECQYCSLDFPALDLVVEHIARAHPGGSNCKICNEKFCNSRGLEQHMKDKHWREYQKEKKKEEAGGVSPEPQADGADEDVDSDGVIEPMEAFTRLPDGLQCNECMVIFPKDSSYARHICNPAAPNRCKRCKLSFGTHLALVRHISMVHGAQNGGRSKFNCKVCGAGFAHEISLQKHISSQMCKV
ncbi:Hypothetical predicted protein [Cloeon dipterum]|uniref:C2H2-type domain-containing protein n=1 Tax=Cloeon dipterum TaxID=197152 RepID=A0A8S1D230_9INSE|nr:Hypothetical predicted protein [Cloeon dipterum]